MRRIEIPEWSVRPFYALDEEWALLVAGRQRPNPMTVSWGGFGTLWERPVVTVYVRPTRHTWSVLAEHPEFTLNLLPPAMKPALDFCGAHSGRDVDKWAGADIRPEPSERVAVPRVAGARYSFECRVLATLDFDPGRMIDPNIQKLYPKKDYHRVFLGGVVAAWAADD